MTPRQLCHILMLRCRVRNSPGQFSPSGALRLALQPAHRGMGSMGGCDVKLLTLMAVTLAV